MNAKAKGARTEHRAIRILEAAGDNCTRAGASLGCFDVIGIGPRDVRCIQVKAGSVYLSGVEREHRRIVRRWLTARIRAPRRPRMMRAMPGTPLATNTGAFSAAPNAPTASLPRGSNL